jgi:lantibiotic biosynthesis protein
MIRGRNGLLEAAARIGRTLCEAAYWRDGRCNWVGRSSREMIEPGLPIVPTVTALGPELYGGTAGIALFLAQLHARTNDDRVSKTARGAILHAMRQSKKAPSAFAGSFYSGLVGIAYAAVRVGILLNAAELVDSGFQLAARGVPASDGSWPLDVIGGNAGAIAPLLWLAELQGDDSLHDRAIELATELAGAATKRDGTWCWDPGRASGKGVGPRPLCGFAHGASGMGLALLEMGVRHRQQEWIEGGLAAFAYEDRLYDDDQQNWPDLREFGSRPAGADAPKSSFMVAWCHGAPGIGLARLHASQLLPGRRTELLTGVERAIRATVAYLRALPAEFDASPCHGRGGLAELLLYATTVLGDRRYADQATEMWKRAAQSVPAAAEWPCGVASGRGNPSLMLGLAGIGYGLLRAQDPSATPSILLIAR